MQCLFNALLILISLKVQGLTHADRKGKINQQYFSKWPIFVNTSKKGKNIYVILHIFISILDRYKAFAFAVYIFFLIFFLFCEHK